jgi:hypothetical protein
MRTHWGNAITHDYEGYRELEIVASQGPSVKDAEHGTHMTIDRAHDIHDDKTKYYAQKRSQSCKGINLSITAETRISPI